MNVRARGLWTDCRGYLEARPSAGAPDAPILQAEGRPVTLGVARDNPRARALYERLGVALVGQDDRHHVLRWEPPHR